MLRILTILAFLATLGMAGVVYKLKYETRALQLQAAQLRRDIRDERNQLAVTKAEWSIVTTPELVEETARKIGLRPLKANQIITLRELSALPLVEDAGGLKAKAAALTGFDVSPEHLQPLSVKGRERARAD